MAKSKPNNSDAKESHNKKTKKNNKPSKRKDKINGRGGTDRF